MELRNAWYSTNKISEELKKNPKFLCKTIKTIENRMSTSCAPGVIYLAPQAHTMLRQKETRKFPQKSILTFKNIFPSPIFHRFVSGKRRGGGFFFASLRIIVHTANAAAAAEDKHIETDMCFPQIGIREIKSLSARHFVYVLLSYFVSAKPTS